MIVTATNYISMFNTNYVEPAIDWIKNHKTVVSAIGISILLGAVCYKSPQALDLMKKQIKFVTIVVPVTYTLTFPVLIFLHLGAGFCGADVNQAVGALLGLYYRSIPKVWHAWFKFVGIAA